MKRALIFTNKELRIIENLLTQKLDTWLTEEEHNAYASLRGYIQKFLIEEEK